MLISLNCINSVKYCCLVRLVYANENIISVTKRIKKFEYIISITTKCSLFKLAELSVCNSSMISSNFHPEFIFIFDARVHVNAFFGEVPVHLHELIKTELLLLSVFFATQHRGNRTFEFSNLFPKKTPKTAFE